MPAWSRKLAVWGVSGLLGLAALRGLTGLVAAYAHPAPGSIAVVTAFVAMTVLFQSLPLQLSQISREKVSMGALVAYISVVALGVWPAVGVKACSAILAAFTGAYPRGRVARNVFFNTGIWAGSVLLAGRVYTLLGGVTGARLTPRLVLPFLALTVVYGVANMTLLATMAALATGGNIAQHIRAQFHRFWLNEVVFAIAGLLTLSLWTALHLVGLAVMAATLLLLRYAFAAYFKNEQFRGELAEALSQALRLKDPYTAEHSARVARLAVRVGMRLGLDDVQLEKLRDSALLHDIGKVAVPDAVLLKPGPLDPQEWQSMVRHVGAGGEILETTPRLRELAHLVRAHHADFGGTPAAGEPPLESRIIAAADAFDAMTSDRPYRRALPHDEAVRRLRDAAGSQFDPGVVAALLQCLAEPEDRQPRPAAEAAPPPAEGAEATDLPCASGQGDRVRVGVGSPAVPRPR